MENRSVLQRERLAFAQDLSDLPNLPSLAVARLR